MGIVASLEALRKVFDGLSIARSPKMNVRGLSREEKLRTLKHGFMAELDWLRGEPQWEKVDNLVIYYFCSMLGAPQKMDEDYKNFLDKNAALRVVNRKKKEVIEILEQIDKCE